MKRTLEKIQAIFTLYHVVFPTRCAQGLCQDTPFCHIMSPFPSAVHKAYVKTDPSAVSRRPSPSAAHRAYGKTDPSAVSRHLPRAPLSYFNPCASDLCDMTKGCMVIKMFITPILHNISCCFLNA